MISFLQLCILALHLCVYFFGRSCHNYDLYRLILRGVSKTFERRVAGGESQGDDFVFHTLYVLASLHLCVYFFVGSCHNYDLNRLILRVSCKKIKRRVAKAESRRGMISFFTHSASLRLCTFAFTSS